MRIPRETRQLSRHLYRSCLLPSGLLSEEGVRLVVDQVVERKPRNYIALLEHFCRLVESNVKANFIKIESAVPLDDQGQSLAAQVDHECGPSTGFTYQHRPDLIGGVRVYRGSVIWDNSVLGRIDRLRKTFELC